MFTSGPTRRRASWSMWLAMRSLVTAIGGIAAAFVLSSLAMPHLADHIKEMGADAPQMTRFVMENHRYLPIVPIPALVLGIAAVVFRSLRTLLAPLAAVASIMALVVVVGSLVVAMMPLYSMPKDLMVG